MLRASRTRSDFQETREETAYIEMTCTVKGYQECPFSVDVGKSFEFLRRSVPKKVHFSVLPSFCSLLQNIYITEHWHSVRYLDVFLSIPFNKDSLWLVLRDLLIKRWIPNKIEQDWVRLCSIVFECVRLVRLVRESNSQQNRCSILFDYRTQSNDWCSIGFDWFLVRFYSIGYAGTFANSFPIWSFREVA